MTLFRRTPAGNHREALTGLLMDYDDSDAAADALTEQIGDAVVRDQKDTVRSNGGNANFSVQDLCRLASNADMEAVCRKLGIRIPKTRGY